LIITIPLWDLHLPADLRVRNTLWAVGAIGLASIITLLLELAFAELNRGDDLARAVADRLDAVAGLLAGYGENRALSEAAAENITRLALVGTSRPRRILARSNRAPRDRERMGAVIALSGRLIDIAASLQSVGVALDDEQRQRVLHLARDIGRTRAAIVNNADPPAMAEVSEDVPRHPVPLLHEMETTVALISAVLAGSPSGPEYQLSPAGDEAPRALFVADARTNPEHVRFGLKGCLAASLCYLIYNALFWPGISTSVTTCFLTALTTVGASHQKQFLRFAGALAGGFGIGMLAQILILPSLDSIGGFTLLFAAVFALSAWFATSSPRLSYFGVQLAVAFALINLSEFKIQISLAAARDRVVGVLLGLSMMWLAFDRLWAVPAGVAMKRIFVANLRLLAESAREPLFGNLAVATARIASLRETLNTQFGKVRSVADGILFEFGPTRQQDLALRDRIRQWQPRLRTFLVLRNTLLKYRLGLPGFELPDSVRLAQQEFDQQVGRVFDRMADRLEGEEPAAADGLEPSLERLEQAARMALRGGAEPALANHLETLLPLCRTAAGLVNSLNAEIA
jgi:multidrug resistance protein MdtO